MVKGFIRLWAVLSVLVWGGAFVALLHESGKNLNLFINPHLICVAGLMGTSAAHANTRWCVFVARPEFLAKPAQERRNIAQAFFAEHIEPIAKITYVDVETFRTNFVTSATLSLQQVPIDTSVDAERTRYRDISAHAWHGGIQLSHIAFARDTLLAAVLVQFQ